MTTQRLMAGLKILAFAAASNRVGAVLLVGDKLMDWQMSSKASRDSVIAAAYAQKLINILTPDIVVTERPEDAKRKGLRTKDIIDAIAVTAANNYVLDVSVKRGQKYANKYAEADALAERYPDLAAWKPEKRRFFDNEPRNTVLFEALALAEFVLNRADLHHN
jgi:hypothetical protein